MIDKSCLSVKSLNIIDLVSVYFGGGIRHQTLLFCIGISRIIVLLSHVTNEYTFSLPPVPPPPPSGLLLSNLVLTLLTLSVLGSVRV